MPGGCFSTSPRHCFWGEECAAGRLGFPAPTRESPRGGAGAPTRGGLAPRGAPGPPAPATHRGGGLPGSGHDDGQRGRHVVTAHPPAGGQRVGSGRELGRPGGRRACEPNPCPPLRARARARARPRATPTPLLRALDPASGPRAPAPTRLRVRVTMQLPALCRSRMGPRFLHTGSRRAVGGRIEARRGELSL